MTTYIGYDVVREKIYYTTYVRKLPEKFVSKHKCHWIKNSFNTFVTEQEYEHGSPVILMRDVTHIMFGDNYNLPTVLTRDVTHLELSRQFKHLIILTSNIRHLTLGMCHNQPLVLSRYIEYLKLENSYNQPLVLSPRIKHLILGTFFDQPIILTKYITHLTLGDMFNQPIVLTKYITHLTFGQYYQPIILTHHIVRLQIENHNYLMMDNLPNGIREIMLCKFFGAPLKNIPNSAKINTGQLFCPYKHPIPQINKLSR